MNLANRFKIVREAEHYNSHQYVHATTTSRALLVRWRLFYFHDKHVCNKNHEELRHNIHCIYGICVCVVVYSVLRSHGIFTFCNYESLLVGYLVRHRAYASVNVVRVWR